MRITVQTPSTGELGPVVTALASWQREGLPVQLHPGDLGWQWRFGAEAVADSLRVWSRDQEPVAIGLLDRDVPEGEVVVIRMALAPSFNQDDDLAHVLVRDLEDSSSGVLPAGPASVEARFGQAFRSRLDAHGWMAGEPWTPLHRDLTHPVDSCALRVETVGPSLAAERVDVQAAAFRRIDLHGRPMAGNGRGDALPAGEVPGRSQRRRCAVAAATVWSAGPGRPGLIEPLGVHRDHRGSGHGTAITLAAATSLQELGSSSATVATPTSNTAAVATYVAAGITAASDVTDFVRPA